MGANQSNPEIEPQFDTVGRTDYISSSESINTFRDQNSMDSFRSEANVSSSSSQASMSNRSHDKPDHEKSKNHGRSMPFTSGIKTIEPKLKSYIENVKENNNSEVYLSKVLRSPRI